MAGYAGGTAEADVRRLRRMTAELGTASTYIDTDLIGIISNYPLPDVTGEFPLLVSGSANTDWTPTYDLANAAADVWDEKVACVADNFDFNADGAEFNKSQVTDHYMKQARMWRSRRKPGTHTQRAYPGLTLREEWIGNLAEDDD